MNDVLAQIVVQVVAAGDEYGFKDRDVGIYNKDSSESGQEEVSVLPREQGYGAKLLHLDF